MGTWGTLEVRSDYEGTIKLETSHDGFLGDTVNEFLSLPFSIMKGSLAQFDWNMQLRSMSDEERKNVSDAAHLPYSFYFSMLFLDDLEVGRKSMYGNELHYKTVADVIGSWDSLIPLRTSAGSVVSFLIWQYPTKWQPVNSYAYGGEPEFLQVSQDRLPMLSLWCEFYDEEEVEEFFETLRESVMEVRKRYLLKQMWRGVDYEKVKKYFPRITRVKRANRSDSAKGKESKPGFKVSMNLDLCVAFLMFMKRIEVLRDY